MALSVEEVEQLRAAGFSDEDIQAYAKEAAGAPQQAAPVDPNAPIESLPKYDETIIPETTPPPENTNTETAIGGVIPAVQAVLPYAGGALGLGGLGYVGKKYAEGKKAVLETEKLKQEGMMRREALKQEALNKRAEMRAAQMQQPGGRAPYAQQPGPGSFQRGTLNIPQPNLQTGMPGDITRAAPATAERPVIFKQSTGQVPVQGPPSAANYMQRMNNLAEQYRGVQTVVNPPAQPAPVQQAQPAQTAPKMTYRPVQGGGMRGGGGGGGGGGMGPFDPNKRWRPMQF